MSSIEDIAKAFAGLPLAEGNRWNLYPMVPDHLYLSRDSTGRYSLFLVGKKETFGTLPRIAGIEFSDKVEAIPSGERVHAVRLTSSSITFGNRVMAHVAYELDRRIRSEPEVANEVLLTDVRWILELLGDRESVLSDEQQKGLVGELVLLRKLLMVAQDAGVPATATLDHWHGYDHAKRDFSGPGLAVEVKTTGGDARIHHVGSLAQLDPQGDEEVFLFSLGIRLDSSAPKKLPDYVADVAQLLVDSTGATDQDLQQRFFSMLSSYGYDVGREALYRACPGFLKFHLLPRLYRERDLDRVRITSFKADQLPSMVVDVAYKLDVQAKELDPSEEKNAFRRLLGLQPIE